MKLTERKIIKIIREEYVKRLLQLEIAAKIAQAQLVDQRGNVLISPDLKVKHKESGYEYTVERIEGEGDSAIIYLRKPDVPRISPALASRPIHEDDEPVAPPIVATPGEEQEDADIFAITVSDFEKEYIID